MTGTDVDRAIGTTRALIPAGTNASLLGLCLACNVFSYFMLPLLLVPWSRAWLYVLLPYVLMTPFHWSITHEAVHSRLHHCRLINEAAGRLASMFFGAAFQSLRFGHLLHHMRNGTPSDRPEYYDPDRSSRSAAALKYHLHLFFGAYAIEFASLFLVLLPRPFSRRSFLALTRRGNEANRDLARRLLRFIDDRRRFREARIDSIASLMLLGAAGYCYGPDWMLWSSALVARAIIRSYLDNGYHYGAPLASEQSAYNLSLPRTVQRALLNFNLHRVHHRYPMLPWSELPVAFDRDGDRFDGGFFDAMLRQLRGPIPSSRYALVATSCTDAVSAKGARP